MRVHMNQPGAQVSQPGKGGWTTGLVDVEASSKGVDERRNPWEWRSAA